jgi:putative ABC transport system ATP-binding protein
MMSLVSAENLSKTYLLGEVEVRALREVSFSIEERSLVSFVGPSGSGKTTLLNLVGCLDRPSGGTINVAGEDPAAMSRTEKARFRGANIGFIFQNFNLIPVLTVYENVEYPLVMVQSVPAAERRRRVGGLLEAVGMAEHRDKRPDQLSGGQKQRAAIARALVGTPKLVLADEPTANLDHATAAAIMAAMRDMTARLGTTFVFSTHDPRVIGEADVVHTLEDGALVSSRKGGE